MDQGVSTLVVTHPSHRKCLLLAAEEGWALPRVLGGASSQDLVGPLQQAIEEQLGWNVAVGRQLQRQKHMYEVELLGHPDLPPGSRWIGREELTDLTLHDADQFPALAAWLEEREVPPLRAPWFRPGWHTATAAWVRTAALASGFTLAAPPRQIKASDSCEVRCFPTTGGDLYFKATGPAARHEAVLTEHLDKAHPGKTVSVVATNPAEGWLLMREVGGESLRSRKEKPLYQRAIREYAELQVREAQHAADLLAMGVPDRRIPRLKAHIQEHLAAMCATGLTAEQTAEVMALQPELLDMCDQMMALGLPDTGDHGDLHTNNIRLVDDRVVFYDWGDASVTHPFFSTRVFWHALDELIASESEWLPMVDQFRPHYLEPWTSFAPMQELQKALAISDQLACVQRALSWHLYLIPGVENQGEIRRRPAQWLELLLEHRTLVQ